MTDYKNYLQEAINPCLFFSGGQDSQELLRWTLKIRKIPIVTFNQNFTKEQWSVVEKTILDFDLECYTFPPTQSYLIPNGKELARVDVYNLGGSPFPVLRDVVHSDRCGLDLDNKTLDLVPFDHDVVFIGTRQNDWSEATGRPLKTDVVEMGAWKLVAPLFYETKIVKSDGRTDVTNEGNLISCYRCCMNGTTESVYCPKESKNIPGHIWDQQKSLQHFQKSFGFK